MMKPIVRSAALLILLASLLGCDSNTSTYVRVRNESGADFSNVVVNENKFGDIKSGEATEYQILAMAYPDPYLSLSIGTNRLKAEPAKYQGEQALGPGRFTYVVNAKDLKL